MLFRSVKGGGIAVPGGEKQYDEGCQLNKNVSEEEFELAMQAPAEHERSDSDLQDGMRDPERVVKKLKFLAHFSRLPASLIGLTWRQLRSTKSLSARANSVKKR